MSLQILDPERSIDEVIAAPVGCREEEVQCLSCVSTIARHLDAGLGGLVGGSMMNFGLGFGSDRLNRGPYSGIVYPEMAAVGHFPKEYAAMNGNADCWPCMA